MELRKYEPDAPSPVECDVELGELQPEYFRNFGAWQKRQRVHRVGGLVACWWLGGLLTGPKSHGRKGEVGIFLFKI